LLAPGDGARAPDGRSLTVVRVAFIAGSLAEGNAGPPQQEILAVGNFSAGPEPAPALAEAGGDSAGVEVSGPLPLPYSLPE
jgi:hypothetical protein